MSASNVIDFAKYTKRVKQADVRFAYLPEAIQDLSKTMEEIKIVLAQKR